MLTALVRMGKWKVGFDSSRHVWETSKPGMSMSQTRLLSTLSYVTIFHGDVIYVLWFNEETLWIIQIINLVVQTLSSLTNAATKSNFINFNVVVSF